MLFQQRGRMSAEQYKHADEDGRRSSTARQSAWPTLDPRPSQGALQTRGFRRKLRLVLDGLELRLDLLKLTEDACEERGRLVLGLALIVSLPRLLKVG